MMSSGSANSVPERHLMMAITGASGAIYAKRLLDVFAASRVRVHLIVSDAGEKILSLELGLKIDDLLHELVTLYDYKDFSARIASGSFLTEGMIIVPCSMGTLGAIAQGISMNLIHRCADVCIKEEKKLILVPRETPLNSIHLENMLKLSRLGVTLLPAMPGFYNKPKTVEDIADFIVARILNQLRIPQNLIKPWDGLPSEH